MEYCIHLKGCEATNVTSAAGSSAVALWLLGLRISQTANHSWYLIMQFEHFSGRTEFRVGSSSLGLQKIGEDSCFWLKNTLSCIYIYIIQYHHIIYIYNQHWSRTQILHSLTTALFLPTLYSLSKKNRVSKQCTRLAQATQGGGNLLPQSEDLPIHSTRWRMSSLSTPFQQRSGELGGRIQEPAKLP